MQKANFQNELCIWKELLSLKKRKEKLALFNKKLSIISKVN